MMLPDILPVHGATADGVSGQTPSGDAVRPVERARAGVWRGAAEPGGGAGGAGQTAWRGAAPGLRHDGEQHRCYSHSAS